MNSKEGLSNTCIPEQRKLAFEFITDEDFTAKGRKFLKGKNYCAYVDPTDDNYIELWADNQEMLVFHKQVIEDVIRVWGLKVYQDYRKD